MSDDPDWIDELYAEGAEGADALPPSTLDENIRAAARQPVQHRWYRSPVRLAALATAASLVIAVSVIYFEPDQPALEAPVAPLEQKRTDHMRSTVLEEEVASEDAAERRPMPTRKSANTPAASLPADAVAPESAAAEPAPKTESDRQIEMTGLAAPVQRTMESDQAVGRAEAFRSEALTDTAIAGRESAARTLIQQCGPLPGDEETREIGVDETGWLVAVTVGADTRIWRCIDGAWIETPSEQQ